MSYSNIVLQNDASGSSSTVINNVDVMNVHSKVSMSAYKLMNSNPKPLKCGYLSKKSNSFWAWLLPFIFPAWKTRFFILIGGYLFRYASELDEKIKGVPIPLDSADIKVNADDRTCLEINLIRKNYLIKTNSEEECNSWIDALRTRKHNSIKESLGHKDISNDTRSINNYGEMVFLDKIKYDRDRINHDDVVNPMSSP